MSNYRRVERHEIDFKFLLNLIRLNLEKCYQKLTPELELSDFNSKLLNVVELRDDPAVEGLVEIIAQCVPEELRKNENDWIARSPHGPIIISCAYRSRAIKAMKVSIRDIDLCVSSVVSTHLFGRISTIVVSLQRHAALCFAVLVHHNLSQDMKAMSPLFNVEN